jgi:Family of unknown function (DUF5397)
MQTQIEPQALIGTWRRFGAIGPAYEIVSIGNELPNGDRAVKIRLAETGEEVNYTFNRLIDDQILADKAH